MSAIKISENVYSVGVQNPGLRVFDIVMESKYGTTYNAYLITGSKIVLVETVHNDFFDEYLYNIECLVDLHAIDYIIMNHTEPDHSGSLCRLLEMNPNIQVVCTAAAQKYLRAIMNRDFKCVVAKNGDTLNIGRDELQFIVAPLLHWPDTMMTYFPGEKVLFTCDFLGCHFCEPNMLDNALHYPEKYQEQFAYYYKGIFSPFKPYVLAGLDKIKDLPLEAVCPSHGPILVEGIAGRMADYRAWSTPEPKSGSTVVIAYASAYGYTKKLAQAAKQAIESSTGVKAELMDMVDTPPEKVAGAIEKSDALLVGSCTINRDAPKVVWDVLSRIDAINTKGRPAGAFGSYGWSGEAVPMLASRLSQLKYGFAGEGFKVNFYPTEEDLAAMGRYALEVVSKIK